ncbi:cardiolipin synthetase 2 [Cohaesibacter sp. ES.047]|uniref:phospholipase D-like domain-containing protein n=1 Tax=Cohaesibacter sp. ES.047 TaxID=1798205 RepID=UPI000BB74202|nr:phospholipase D-like domain-containing protein [Cohaesibacter sp. ES.047]SNY93606.1 cardiolipin synthetase 2 [Cohaesibacter sp. ES.047]
MSWLITHLAIVAISLVIAASALVILGQKRSPQATLAWLLFLILLPYVALPLYLTFGFRKSTSSAHQLADRAGAQPKPDHPEKRVINLLQNSGFSGSAGNSFKMHEDGIKAWESLRDIIANAEISLDITFYLLASDPVGEAFCALLEERAKAGVSVHLILDRFGSLQAPWTALRRLKAAGAEVRLYSPFTDWAKGVNISLRNHRKMVIADGQRVWAGGRNVATHYLGPQSDEQRWIDFSFVVEGPVVEQYIAVFSADWTFVGGSHRPESPVLREEKGSSSLNLIPSGPNMADDLLYDAVVLACHQANARIWIFTPYFTPTPNLTQALSIAARRGVDVRILLPEKSNQWLADLARGPALRSLGCDGVRILTLTKMIHAKAILIDDSAFVGSANFDSRSLLLNYETMLFVRSVEDISALTCWMNGVMTDASEELAKSSLWRRFSEGVFRLISPIL